MIKQLLIEILDFYRYKIANDKCTQADMKSAYEILSKHVVSEATVKDIAEFYSQSESNVRNVISRHVTDRPKRVNLYKFGSFLKFVPKRWIEQRKS